MTKIIIFTGGVYSSVGKGITLASVGRILQNLGFKVSALKLDPYLNLSSGSLSPYQHGEVYVTADGLETDLDLGHYERFMDYELSKHSCITAGRVYFNLLEKQKVPKFLGNTIQVIPDLIEEIYQSIEFLLKKKRYLDFLLIEVGGTVGDIESIPFLEAAQHMVRKLGRENIMFVHISPVIFLKINKEFKTKPIQHSIKQLLSFGIIPNLLIVRSERNLPTGLKKKISTCTSIDNDNIFFCIDQKIIYLIPECLFKEGMHKKILEYFKIPLPVVKPGIWNRFAEIIHKPSVGKVKVGIIGKYSSICDSYISIIESFKLAAYTLHIDIHIDVLGSEDIENIDLSVYSHICVPHGFGERGVEEKIKTINYCRENKIPFLGICFGMQLACIEYARNFLNLLTANTSEADANSDVPLFIRLPNDYESDMRLGNKDIKIYKNTFAYKLFKTEKIVERHRHKYFFNPKYRSIFDNTDFIISAVSDDNLEVVEIIELKNHPFFVGVQFHPEFSTKPFKISPLFLEFLKSSREF